MFEYSPFKVYLFTFIVCLLILIKALKDVCKKNENELPTEDFCGARKSFRQNYIFEINWLSSTALISPDVFIVPVNSHPPYTINNLDDCPPPYDSIASPPPYEESFKDLQLPTDCQV